MHNVPDHAIVIEVSASALDTKVFFEVDLDGGDVVLVPRRAEHLIGESKTEKVLHHFVAEEVIHTVDLILAEESSEMFRELFSAFEVTAERFLHYNSRRASKIVIIVR